jgi:HK97 gp10 family phage protein
MALIQVKTSLAGDQEIIQLLRDLPKRLAKGALRKALRAGANVVMRGARFRAPRKSGLLAKTIKTRAFRRTRKNIVGFTVSANIADYQGNTFYASFQEYGWVATGRAGADPGIRSSMKLLSRQRKNGVNWLAKRKRNRDGKLVTDRDGKWRYDNVFSQIRAEATTAAKIRVAKYQSRKVKPKYFLRDAFQDNAAQIQADLAKSIKEELRAAALKAPKK